MSDMFLKQNALFIFLMPFHLACIRKEFCHRLERTRCGFLVSLRLLPSAVRRLESRVPRQGCAVSAARDGPCCFLSFVPRLRFILKETQLSTNAERARIDLG